MASYKARGGFFMMLWPAHPKEISQRDASIELSTWGGAPSAVGGVSPGPQSIEQSHHA